MWAVIRYSTGRRVAYFTDEMSARMYVDDQNKLDESLGESTPDWGWMLVPMTDALRELLETQ